MSPRYKHQEKRPEDIFRGSLLDNLWHQGHFCSVESPRSSPGIPDIDYCSGGIEGHLELKVWGRNSPTLRPTQIKWFEDRVKAGGYPLILTMLQTICNNDQFLVHPGSMIRKLHMNKTRRYWIKTAYVKWDDNVNYPQLLALLQNPGKTYG